MIKLKKIINETGRPTGDTDSGGKIKPPKDPDKELAILLKAHNGDYEYSKFAGYTQGKNEEGGIHYLLSLYDNKNDAKKVGTKNAPKGAQKDFDGHWRMSRHKR